MFAILNDKSNLILQFIFLTNTYQDLIKNLQNTLLSI